MFCYECHEELLHNPVLLPEDIELFALLVRIHDLSEESKPANRSKIARRVALFHDVITRGLRAMYEDETGGGKSNNEMDS